MTTPSDFLADYPEKIRTVAEDLHALLLDALPDEAIVVVQTGHKNISYYLGEQSMAGMVAYVAPFSKHVNLGFTQGVALDDPEGLLTGTGKSLRHVKCRTPDDVQRPAVRALIEQAVARATE